MVTKILKVSGWDCPDEYYRVPIKLLKELKIRINRDGMEKSWDWFLELTAYNGRPTAKEPIKALSRVSTSDTYGDFFLDSTNPKTSISDWELD